MAQSTISLYVAGKPETIDPEALKAIREELSISQAEASARVDAGAMAWYRWETGKHAPRRVYHRAIEELAELAGIPAY